jgi:hypothetical protein
MTQISRPFQIALVAMGLFVAIWFVALRGHSSDAGSSSSSAPSPSSSSSAASSSSPATPANPGSVYRGSAPGVAGLTRAIDKARGAVAQSQQNAHQLQQKSAQASSNAPAHASGSGAAATSRGTTVVKVHKTTTTKQPGAKASAGGASAKSATAPKMQTTVEAELKQGKIVTILFWNPKASVDVKVRKELNALGREQGGKIAVHDALANQVGSFGNFTRTVQVYGTPTILIVNKQGQTTSLTGLTDVFSLEQAVTEAKSAH